jgi:hypothetical protein
VVDLGNFSAAGTARLLNRRAEVYPPELASQELWKEADEAAHGLGVTVMVKRFLGREILLRQASD